MIASQFSCPIMFLTLFGIFSIYGDRYLLGSDAEGCVVFCMYLKCWNRVILTFIFIGYLDG